MANEFVLNKYITLFVKNVSKSNNLINKIRRLLPLEIRVIMTLYNSMIFYVLIFCEIGLLNITLNNFYELFFNFKLSAYILILVLILFYIYPKFCYQYLYDYTCTQVHCILHTLYH